MTQWTTFAAITGVVLVLLLVLSTLTQSTFDEIDLEDASSDAEERSDADGERGSAADAADARGPDADAAPAVDDDTAPEPDWRADADLEGATATGDATPTDASRDAVSPDASADLESDVDADRVESDPRDPVPAADRSVDPESLTTGMVLANVAASQGLFALVVLGAVVYTGVPADALGIEFSLSYLETGLVLGTAAGIALYLANELGAAVATRFGFDHDEQLRELLAPESGQGWAVLLGVVLPVVAVFEELLFRAALIGAMEAGFGVSPWLLAVVSSVAFALGHGIQGSVGVVVTGALGFVLAAVFVVTGSFLVVVVAHYLINALEFVVHEGLGFDWASALER